MRIIEIGRGQLSGDDGPRPHIARAPLLPDPLDAHQHVHTHNVLEGGVVPKKSLQGRLGGYERRARAQPVPLGESEAVATTHNVAIHCKRSGCSAHLGFRRHAQSGLVRRAAQGEVERLEQHPCRARSHDRVGGPTSLGAKSGRRAWTELSESSLASFATMARVFRRVVFYVFICLSPEEIDVDRQSCWTTMIIFERLTHQIVIQGSPRFTYIEIATARVVARAVKAASFFCIRQSRLTVVYHSLANASGHVNKNYQNHLRVRVACGEARPGAGK
ncbi:unnamed protein product, partial [Trichogramma brassicae]